MSAADILPASPLGRTADAMDSADFGTIGAIQGNGVDVERPVSRPMLCEAEARRERENMLVMGSTHHDDTSGLLEVDSARTEHTESLLQSLAEHGRNVASRDRCYSLQDSTGIDIPSETVRAGASNLARV